MEPVGKPSVLRSVFTLAIIGCGPQMKTAECRLHSERIDANLVRFNLPLDFSPTASRVKIGNPAQACQFVGQPVPSLRQGTTCSRLRLPPDQGGRSAYLPGRAMYRSMLSMGVDADPSSDEDQFPIQGGIQVAEMTEGPLDQSPIAWLDLP